MTVPNIPPIQWTDVAEYVVLAGSHGYGTNVPESDVDHRGFFMPDRSDVFGFREGPESRVVNNGLQDDTLWEFRKYVRLCAQANPNVIETLFAEPQNVLRAGDTAMALREARNAFLSKTIARTYLGYATGNYKRVINGDGKSDVLPAYDVKDAMHLVRLVRTGREALQTGVFRVFRPEDREDLLAIRRGQVPIEKIKEEFEQAKKDWPELEAKSPLPERPDLCWLDEYTAALMSEHARKRGW